MEIIPLVKGSEASNHVENPQRHQGGHIGLTWVNDGKRCTTTYIILYLTMKSSKCALTLHLPLPPGYVPTELDGHPERYPLQPPGLSFMS
jgi:hypothetical protein